MKKVLFIALAAAALAACTKTEANYTASQEISFMPVSKFDTKAAVEGDEFTADQNFYVFANTTNEALYFTKVLFKPTSSTTTEGLTIYSGNPAQYWPNTTPLKFAGYTASGNTETAEHQLHKSFENLKVIGYIQPQPTVVDAKNDLMWFFECGANNEGYLKTTAPVTPVMKHACSWITINVMADDELVEYWKDLKVINIHFVNLHEKGTVTFPNAANGIASWDFTDMTVTPYVNILTASKSVAETPALVKDLVEFADVPKNTIVLPQTPTNLSITYSYTTPAGVTGFTETKVLPLDYDGVDGTNTEWAPGKHYTYNLTLTAEEIKIAPSSTDWTIGSNSHINF